MDRYLDYKMATDSLYQTRFPDGYVVWKPLPWNEFRKLREAHVLMGERISAEVFDYVYSKCVVYSSFDAIPPEDLSLDIEKAQWIACSREDQEAGVLETVSKLILMISGARPGPPGRNDVAYRLDVNRRLAMGLEDQMVALVCKAFPAYKPEEVELLSWETILKRAAQAEQMLGITINLEDPEEAAKAQASSQKVALQSDIAEALKVNEELQKKRKIREEQERVMEEKQREAPAKQLRREYLRNRGNQDG